MKINYAYSLKFSRLYINTKQFLSKYIIMLTKHETIKLWVMTWN